MSEDPKTAATIGAWSTLEVDVVADVGLFRLRRRQATSPSDPTKSGQFVYLDSPDWVNVVALTPDRRVVLIEQFRHGTLEVTVEIPGGTVDAGEDARGAGLRELREETGYVGRDCGIIGSVAPNPAIQNNHCHTLLVRDARREGEPTLEGMEEIAVRLATLDEVSEMIRDGTIDHALVVAAFHHLDLHRQEST